MGLCCLGLLNQKVDMMAEQSHDVVVTSSNRVNNYNVSCGLEGEALGYSIK